MRQPATWIENVSMILVHSFSIQWALNFHHQEKVFISTFVCSLWSNLESILNLTLVSFRVLSAPLRRLLHFARNIWVRLSFHFILALYQWGLFSYFRLLFFLLLIEATSNSESFHLMWKYLIWSMALYSHASRVTWIGVTRALQSKSMLPNR